MKRLPFHMGNQLRTFISMTCLLPQTDSFLRTNTLNNITFIHMASLKINTNNFKATYQM